MDSVKMSFKTRNSSFLNSSSRGGSRDNDLQEELPILLRHNANGNGNGNGNGKIWRESSYDFWPNGRGGRAAGGNGDGEVLVDMNLESSKELRVSFGPTKPSDHASSNESDNEQSSPEKDAGLPASGEAIRCSSNSSFRRTSTLLRSRTKSRLMEPVVHNNDDRRSVKKSGQLKATNGKAEEEDEDPFMEEDLPSDFKKRNISILTILQWVSLVVIVGALVCSLTIRFLQKKTVWGLHLWKWEVLVLVLICGRLVSGWGIKLVVFVFERNFLLRKRILYFVYGVRKAVQNSLWLGLVLLAWHLMFDDKVKRETRSMVLTYVTKVLVCLLVGTLIWLVKTLLVKSLASSFHVSTFFDRIQEALFNQYVIESLSGPPRMEVQTVMVEEAAGKSGRVIGGRSGVLPRSIPVAKSIRFSGALVKKGEEGITIDHLHKLNQKNVSAWNMKKLTNMVRHGVLSTLDEQISGANQNEEDEMALQIRSENQAKIAAKKIFTNVAKPGSRYVHIFPLFEAIIDFILFNNKILSR